VLDLSGPDAVLLRPGGATLEAIEALIGPVLRGATPGAALRSPGLLASHYAPSLPVRLNVVTVAGDEALLAFGPPLPGAAAVFQLSESADPTEAAARLFEGLRALDAEGVRKGLRGIAVMPIPREGLGLAIADRLERAAAPR
jgi:L-threonylcarbamoyladenylate synthase